MSVNIAFFLHFYPYRIFGQPKHVKSKSYLLYTIPILLFLIHTKQVPQSDRSYMDLKLHAKRALITGSSAGIGQACAKLLAEEGATVVIHGRNERELERTAAEIKDKGGTVHIVKGDLSIDEEAKRVCDEALEAVGTIDILVNNAGAYHYLSDWLTTEPKEWLDIFNINVVSMVRMIHWLTPKMTESGWGRIIQIASVAGTHPKKASPDYSASKCANINMTVSLSKELTGTGITVNTVSPGPILTKSTEEMFRELAKTRKWGSDWANIEKHAMQEFYPISIGRFGKPEEVAALVTFLASPLADFITGADYRIDGGRAGSIN